MRAVFDNASFVITGEDVKVAGVKVGQIDDVDLEPDNKAAVVLPIDDPAFQPFRRDAHCQIRLQSLIGEQFIECEPTQRARRAGQAGEAADGDRIAAAGRASTCCRSDNTTTPVAVDLLNDITASAPARAAAAASSTSSAPASPATGRACAPRCGARTRR